jgi:hypothetical protein
MTRLRVSFSELIILEMILRCVYRHRIRLKYFYAGTCESAAFFQQAPYIAGLQRRELKRERGLFRLAAAKDGNGHGSERWLRFELTKAKVFQRLLHTGNN